MNKRIAKLFGAAVFTVALLYANPGSAQYKRYPYVQDGKTIVCREGNDGVKASLIHRYWVSAPDHNETDATYNRVSAKFEVAENLAGNALSWSDAEAACATYSQASAGKGAWRLPTVRELRLIVSLGQQLTLDLEPGGSAKTIWSSTMASSNKNNAWSVSSDAGTLSNEAKGTSHVALCVRDIDMPPVSQDYPKVVDGNTLIFRDEQGMANPEEYPLHGKWVSPRIRAETNANNNASGLNTIGEVIRFAATHIVCDTWFKASGTDKSGNPTGTSLCSSYAESPDKTDAGNWRLPTAKELAALDKFRDQLEHPSDHFHVWCSTLNSSRDEAWTEELFYNTFESRPYDIRDYSWYPETYVVICVRDLDAD